MGCLSFSVRCEKDEMEGDAKSILENLKLSTFKFIESFLE